MKPAEAKSTLLYSHAGAGGVHQESRESKGGSARTNSPGTARGIIRFAKTHRQPRLQKPGGPQEAAQRPRTRAWAKQEEQRKEEAIVVTSSASYQKPGKASAKQASLPRHAGSSRQPRPDINPPSPSLPLQAADRPAGNTRQRKAEARKDPKASHEEGRKRTLRGLHVTEEVVEDSPVRPSSVPPPRVSHLAH